ncbi:MAG: HIRAN domain-containing protein [Nanoarchaeota archaeon]
MIFNISGVTFVNPDIFKYIKMFHFQNEIAENLPEVKLQRDLENAVDRFAIRIITKIKNKWFHIGWVPRDINQRIYILMGKQHCLFPMHVWYEEQEKNISLNVPIVGFRVQLQW